MIRPDLHGTPFENEMSPSVAEMKGGGGDIDLLQSSLNNSAKDLGLCL